MAGTLRWLLQLADVSLINMRLFQGIGAVIDGDAAEEPRAPLGSEVAVVLSQSLRRLTRLKALRLDGNDMSGHEGIAREVVRGVGGASGLTVLSLRDTGVTEEQVHALRLHCIPPKAVVYLKEQK